MGLVLIAMSVRIVVGLILGCCFIVGGEVAVAIWALAAWGGDLGMVPKAIGQETSPADVHPQIKSAVAPLGGHALGVGGFAVEERAVARGEGRGDQVYPGVGAERHHCKGPHHRGDYSTLLAVFVESPFMCSLFSCRPPGAASTQVYNSQKEINKNRAFAL